MMTEAEEQKAAEEAKIIEEAVARKAELIEKQK